MVIARRDVGWADFWRAICYKTADLGRAVLGDAFRYDGRLDEATARLKMAALALETIGEGE